MAEPQAAGLSPAKSRPALKLVKTQDLSREQWLDIRKGGIGSSDAAAAVGLNPYQSPLQLWMEKTGRDALLPKVSDPSPFNPTQAQITAAKAVVTQKWAAAVS